MNDQSESSSTMKFEPGIGNERSRVTFATGATRDEKVAGQTSQFPMRFDLLLSNTDFLKRIAATYGEGAAKYSDDNWRNGIPEKSLFNHCLAHLVQHLEGDTTEDHLAHAIWNLMTLMWVQVNKPELLDLTGLTGKGKLQPCNSQPMQAEAEPVEDLEPDLALRETLMLMGNRLHKLNLEWVPEVREILRRARLGRMLSDDEFVKLRRISHAND